MPKIVINEIDETSAGVYAEKLDVVYIPGFVDTKQYSLQGKDGYVGIKANKPMQFNSVAEFESLCGTAPAMFEKDQKYSDLAYEDGDANIFTVNTESLLKALVKDYPTLEIAPGVTTLPRISGVLTTHNGQVLQHKDLNGNVIYEGTANMGTYLRNLAGEIGEIVVVLEQSVNPGSQLIHTYKSASMCVGTEFDDKNDIDVQNWVSVTNYVLSPDDNSTVLKFSSKAYGKADDLMFKEGTADPAYVMAKELLAMGLSVLYERVNTDEGDMSEVSIKTMYRALDAVYDAGKMEGLSDKGNFSIKYLTSGGYPVYEYNKNSVVASMIALCSNPNPDGTGGRGDCVAIIDHTDNQERSIDPNRDSSLYKSVRNDQIFKVNGEFATMFTPWAEYVRTTSDTGDRIVYDAYNVPKVLHNQILDKYPIRMPASFAYLMALGDSIKTNASWLAVAGSARGGVLNLAEGGMTTEIPNGIADAMQPRDNTAVNAITNIKPYGWTIWGNRTLSANKKGNLTATSFLNVRNLVSDVKKTVYRVARQLTFEQNNDVLWTNFKGLIAPKLDQMVSGYGISGYKILRDTTHEKASEKATVCAKIILYPVYAVEDFYVTIVLRDDEVSVS